jgi:hypothetical protein
MRFVTPSVARVVGPGDGIVKSIIGVVGDDRDVGKRSLAMVMASAYLGQINGG